MKKTKTLKVSVSVAVAQDHLVLHPNEGFDLGLMRVGHPLRLCSNIPIEDYLKGSDGESFNVHVDLLLDHAPEAQPLEQRACEEPVEDLRPPGDDLLHGPDQRAPARPHQLGVGTVRHRLPGRVRGRLRTDAQGGVHPLGGQGTPREEPHRRRR